MNPHYELSSQKFSGAHFCGRAERWAQGALKCTCTCRLESAADRTYALTHTLFFWVFHHTAIFIDKRSSKMTSTTQSDLRLRVLEATASLGNSDIKISDLFEYINSDGEHPLTTHASLDHALDDLKREGAITRRRGFISICADAMTKASSEMKETSTGDWGGEEASPVNWSGKELKGKVQGKWSDGKWYSLNVLKKQKGGTYNCLFISTGHEAFMPTNRLRIIHSTGAGPQDPKSFGTADDLKHHIESYPDNHVITQHKPETVLLEDSLDDAL
jgi:hypothetical protein